MSALTSLPSRSKAAFLMSAEALAEISQRLYFWTFTWAEILPVSECRRTWNRFTNLLHGNTSERFAALRVWELHPGGHGLHVHMLTNERIDVNVVRCLLARAGMGVVCHVRGARLGDEAYMAKYMRKGRRIPGVRQWAKLGKWQHVRCGGLVFESQEANFFRQLYHSPQVQELPPSMRWVETRRLAILLLPKWAGRNSAE